MSGNGRDGAESASEQSRSATDEPAGTEPAEGGTGGDAAKRRRPGMGREEQVRPHRPQGGRPGGARQPVLLPDEGAMVDEHGRPPGVPSRTGTGSGSPPSDQERVDRAAAEAVDPGTPGHR
ncbi:hypothetical protein ACIQV3_01865 [Streptomyces sp. NPDC099050]|uniref:hypothetical protein n=1 Tax=Streptomyces sp. NPDC099050 TaxID=3366100 RepID=UPI00382E6B97